jgi:hypothetical protein
MASMGGGAPAGHPHVAPRSATADAEQTRAAFVRAYDAAKAASDVEAMTDAALGLAGTHMWGTVPGRLPAFLYEAYTVADGARRDKLAVAIARAWAYSGDPGRAAPFAAEALADAEGGDDREALAAALDASLLVHWGPDDLSERVRITARLEDVVAHLTDVEARMSAHLWRLTTALETLDRPVAIRQLRALDTLAAESGSPRVAFFAASRRAMHALIADDLPTARASARDAIAAGWHAGEPDAYAIERALTAAIARQEGDVAALSAEAARFEAFALREGATSVGAEAALLWQAAGDLDRAAALLHQLSGSPADGAPFTKITRDVEWLLTVVSLSEVAAAVGDISLCEAAVTLLQPYAGRGVVNGGAVGFAGVVDDYLARACAVLGREEEARRWAATAADAYGRMGAVWWARRASPPSPRPPAAPIVVAHLRLGSDGIWWLGRAGALVAVRDVKGLHYLRLLLARPGLDVPAVELSDAVAGRPGTGPMAAAGLEILDRAALAAYRQRLADIGTEIDEATAWTDPGRVAVLEDERDAVLAELRAATGLGGRARETSGTGERARVAVRKAVVAAIQRIAAVDRDLGRLLTHTVHTGSNCRYDPDPTRPTRWVLADPPRQADLDRGMGAPGSHLSAGR